MKKRFHQSRRTQRRMTRIQRHGRVRAVALRGKQRLRDAAIILILFVTISLFCVWSRVDVLQTGYRIHDLAGQFEKRQEEYRALKLELATRKSPTRLAPMAQEKLGLKQPRPDQVVVVPHSIHIAEQGR